MEFLNWPYTQSTSTTPHDEMYDQQLHSCGAFIPLSSNWCNPEENYQMTQSIADVSNPGRLDQVFPIQSSPDPFTIQYNHDFDLSSWQNQDPGTENHFFYIPKNATLETPENPLLYIPEEATLGNPEKPEFSVSNFISQSDLNADYSQLEPPQIPNSIHSSENCLPFSVDALEEYDGISRISSDLEILVNSMSHNMYHSVKASQAEFNEMICMDNELEETTSQISREPNPGGSIVTTISDHSRMVSNSAGNHTHHALGKLLNPEIEFHHALEDYNPDLNEAGWVKATQLFGMEFSERSSSQRATMEVEEHSQAETMISPVKEMMYCAAALKPVNQDHEVVEEDQNPKRKNVRISSDPQTVAARQRRERISERLKILQKLVPGGGKLDTASMLEEAANYLKFLKAQIKALEDLGHRIDNSMTCMPVNLMFSTLPFCHSFPMGNNISLYQLQSHTQYFHQPQD